MSNYHTLFWRFWIDIVFQFKQFDCCAREVRLRKCNTKASKATSNQI